MYNMDISLFGYKFNLEVLILIGVIYLILVGHLFCGCCHYSFVENFDVSGNNVAVKRDGQKLKNLQTQVAASGKTTEGFSGLTNSFDQSSSYDLTKDTPIDTSSWNASDMTIQPGKPLSKGVKDFMNRIPQPVPLPEGELLLFANTEFKPECCPNTFSTSTGCACMTGEQYNYLILRGGNNVPYSEF